MRPHPLNVTHLVFGLAFLGIAGCWALTEADVVDARAGWLVPLVLLGAGLIGLAASLAQGVKRSRAGDLETSRDLPDELPEDQPDGLPDDEEPTTPV